MTSYSFKNRFLASLLAALFLLSFSSVSAQKLTPYYNTYINGNCNGYYIYTPEGYSSTGTTKYPVILFIHGVNEKGSGSTSTLSDVLGFGLPKLIKNGGFPTSFVSGGKTQRFIVVIPQFRNWPSAGDVAAVIDYTNNKFRTNPAKVYLTGLSMGGGVCWQFGANATYNKKIAAMVPVCGAASPSTTKAYAIADAPVKAWGTHNLYDGTVSSSYTKNWISYMKQRSSTNPAKATLFDATGHNAWSKTYSPTFKENNMNIYEWMLQYSSGTTTTTNAIPVANAGSDKTITLPTTSVTLSGSGTDANGSISKYSWTKISGPSTYTFSSTSSATPTLTSLVAGTYVFRLTVTDNAGATDTDDMSVIVKSALTTVTTVALPGKVEAEKYSAMSGIITETTTDAGGGSNIRAIDKGDWADYSVKTSASGTFNVSFRILCGVSGGSQFQVKNSSGTILTTVTVPYTGETVWKTITASVKLASGTQTIRIYGANVNRWKLNYMSFATSLSSTTTVTTSTVTKVEAESYTSMSGVSKETTKDAGGGQDVYNIDYDDWMIYNVKVPTSGTYTFNFRFASSVSNGKLQIINASHVVLATVSVPNTGGTQTWKTVSATVKLAAGTQDLILYSSATPRFSINYFTFAAATTTSNALASDVSTTSVTETAGAVNAAPNPFSSTVVITVNNTLTGTMKLQMIDASGVVRKDVQVAKNAAGSIQTYVSASALPAGTYFVKVQMDGWNQTTQVVKL